MTSPAGGHPVPPAVHLDDAASVNTAQHSMALLHDHADTDMSTCPHCATPADDLESAPSLCVTESTSNASGPQVNPAPDNVKLVTLSRLTTSPSAAAPPPLIFAIPSGNVSHFERTPLNIRYCVFLI